MLFYGYSNGTVSFHSLEDVDEDNINRRTNQIKNVEELRLSGLVKTKVEHKEAILSIDCCARKRLLLTSRYERVHPVCMTYSILGIFLKVILDVI